MTKKGGILFGGLLVILVSGCYAMEDSSMVDNVGRPGTEIGMWDTDPCEYGDDHCYFGPLIEARRRLLVAFLRCKYPRTSQVGINEILVDFGSLLYYRASDEAYFDARDEGSKNEIGWEIFDKGVSWYFIGESESAGIVFKRTWECPIKCREAFAVKKTFYELTLKAPDNWCDFKNLSGLVVKAEWCANKLHEFVAPSCWGKSMEWKG